MELDTLIKHASANPFVKQFKEQLCPECNMYKGVHAYKNAKTNNIWYLCADCKEHIKYDFIQLSVKEEFVIKSLC